MGGTCAKQYCTKAHPCRTNPDWMSRLPDDAMLSSLTIPGTHDSGALHSIQLAKCQSWSLADQLQAGIRFFDLRLHSIKDKLRVYHGCIDMKMECDEIMLIFKNFITAHPSETIFMSLKQEEDDEDCTKNMETLVNEYIAPYLQLIITYPDRDMPVSEFRGKIVYFPILERSFRIKNFLIQNEWEVPCCCYGMTMKKRFIKRHFNRTQNVFDGLIYLNYLSGSNCHDMRVPKGVAKQTNWLVFKYSGRMGFVLADYPSEDMVDWLIERNFSNRLKKQNDVEEIKTGMNVSFVNMNTYKYMTLDKKTQKVYCSKNVFAFTIETMNDNKNKNIDSGNEKETNKDNLNLIENLLEEDDNNDNNNNTKQKSSNNSVKEVTNVNINTYYKVSSLHRDFTFKFEKYISRFGNENIRNGDVIEITMILDGKEYKLNSDYNYKEGDIQPINVNGTEKFGDYWIIYSA